MRKANFQEECGELSDVIQLNNVPIYISNLIKSKLRTV